MRRALTEEEKIAVGIGERLRRARLNANRTTQQRLANKLGYRGGPTINAYESGKVCPAADTLFMAALCLDVPISSLFPDPPGKMSGTLESRLMRAWKAMPDETAARLLVEVAERMSAPREPTHQRGRTEVKATQDDEPPALLKIMQAQS